MDFEIEGDDDDYNFEWGETSKPAAKKNSMFGADAGGYEDETEYNFSYENDRGSKKKYEPFSPVSTHHSAPVSKAAAKNVPVVNSGNALERAQSLMDKYSGKTVSAPTSNFRNQNMRTFSEADISMSSSEEEASEFEMSESMDDTPVGKKGGKKDSKGKSKPAAGGGGKRDINALDSKAHVVVSMGESMDDDDYLSEQDEVAAPPRSLKHAPKFDESVESEGSGVSEGSGDSAGSEESGEQGEDGNEYSNEEFDQDVGESYEESAEEVGESTHLSATVDTEPDLSNRYVPAVSQAPVGVQFAVRNGTSANFPNNNATSTSNTTNTNTASSNAANGTSSSTNANPSSSYYTTNNAQSVFNNTRRPSSPTYSDTSDSTRPVSPEPVEEEGRDRSGLSDSPNENNASYSRLVYGNEDEHSSVSSEHSANHSNSNSVSVSAMNATGGSRGSRSSKPKVFSFADLLSQESFDATAKDSAPNTNNNNNNVNIATLNTTNLNEVSELQDEFTRPVAAYATVASAGNTASANATKAVINTSTAAPVSSPVPVVSSVYATNSTSATSTTQMLPTRSDSPPTTTTNTAKPTTNTNNTAASTAANTTTNAAPQYAYPYAHPPPPSHALPPHPHPTHPTHTPPYPYPYPTTDANGQPLPPPVPPHALQSPYYPYPYPPPPPQYYPYQYYPYPYPPPPPPQHPSVDPRFSMDYNPLLHGATPTLNTLEALSNPHMRASYPHTTPYTTTTPSIHSYTNTTHSVPHRLSLSEANQVHGSAYFDRDVAQQPLVIDLLLELRKSKEEAAWAKTKLAETIVKLGQQQHQQATPLVVPPTTSANAASGGVSVASSVGRTSGGSGGTSGGVSESKVATPEKVKKHNAVSFLQDVISPVQPVRGSVGGAASNSVGAKKRLDESDEVESDAEDSYYAPDHEESEHDEDDNSADGEGYSDYSDDFEQENNNNNSPAKGKKTSSGSNGGTNSTNTGATNTNNTTTTTPPNPSTNPTTTTTTPHYSGPTLAEVKRAQEEASRGMRERERVMNPLKESLAYSLLASQELFKNQLESLRARIAATNDYTTLMQQRVNTQWDTINTGVSGGSGGGAGGIGVSVSGGGYGDFGDASGPSLPFQPTPSLHHLRSSFESRRVASSEKLLDLLTQVYPNMTLDEATRLAAKI